MQYLVAVEHLCHAGVRLAPFFDGGEKFAVLQFNAIHGHIHLADINFLILAVEQIVIACDVGGAVANVAKECAQWAMAMPSVG